MRRGWTATGVFAACTNSVTPGLTSSRPHHVITLHSCQPSAAKSATLVCYSSMQLGEGVYVNMYFTKVGTRARLRCTGNGPPLGRRCEKTFRGTAGAGSTQMPTWCSLAGQGACRYVKRLLVHKRRGGRCQSVAGPPRPRTPWHRRPRVLTSPPSHVLHGFNALGSVPLPLHSQEVLSPHVVQSFALPRDPMRRCPHVCPHLCISYATCMCPHTRLPPCRPATGAAATCTTATSTTWCWPAVRACA